jgi:hypothetical protein
MPFVAMSRSMNLDWREAGRARMTRHALPLRVACLLLVPLFLHDARGEDLRKSPDRIANHWYVSQRESAEQAGGDEDTGSRVQVRELLTNLSFPGSLTIQPETGRIHFVENGSGRIRRLTGDEQPADVLHGLPGQQDSQQPNRLLAEYHVAFLDQNHLIIGTGPRESDQSPGSDSPVPAPDEPEADEPVAEDKEKELPADTEVIEGWLRLFRLSSDDKPISVDPLSPQQALPVTEQSLGARRLRGLLATRTSLYLIARRDNSLPWLARSVPAEDDLGPVEDLTAPQNPAQGGSPTALTIDPHRNLLVARRTNRDEEDSSRLAFCHNRTGEVWVEFVVPLPRITGLAYHPESGRLLALVATIRSPQDPSADSSRPGGLYELVATREQGKPGVAANQIMELDHPSSMVFDESGILYVTQWGDTDEADDPATSGSLLRIELKL